MGSFLWDLDVRLTAQNCHLADALPYPGMGIKDRSVLLILTKEGPPLGVAEIGRCRSARRTPQIWQIDFKQAAVLCESHQRRPRSQTKDLSSSQSRVEVILPPFHCLLVQIAMPPFRPAFERVFLCQVLF